MSMRGATAITGIGGTPFYRRGQGEPESKMLLRAAVAACRDAGISPREVDGFATYGDGHDEGPLLATSLGVDALRFSVVASGGGGGVIGAIAAGAAAIHASMATNVLVYRALGEAESGRQEFVRYHFTSLYRAQGVVSAVQSGALKTQRMLEADGVPPTALEAFVRACYFHASRNPEAIAYERPLSPETYRASRVISDPNRVYDCSRESDGAFAVLLTSAERARATCERPAYVMAVGQSGLGEDAGNGEPYVTASMRGAARRLWEQSGVVPADVDVAQIYENTSGPAVMALLDHGFCSLESAAEFLTFENLTAPLGTLPVNTAGGNLAAGFVHGMGLPVEAVRQLRGTSANQVPDARLSLVTGGPQAQITGSVLLGTAEALD